MHPVGSELFHAGRTDRQYDESNSRFSQLVNAPKTEAATACHIPGKGCCPTSETQSHFSLTRLYSVKLNSTHISTW